jgi:hypothetical protein
MCTVSFTYDAHNPQARRLVSQLRESGLFKEVTKKRAKKTKLPEEVEAFVYTSRHNASKIFASKL